MDSDAPTSPTTGPAPLDAFTQELVRENELLIADVDQLRENEDRLIEQITALQSQLQGFEGHMARELAAADELIAEKEAETAALRAEKDAEIAQLKEELLAMRHTLQLQEESSQSHHEQIEGLEAELEEARAEIAELKAAAEEALVAIRAEQAANSQHATAAAASAERAVAASLTELTSSVKYMQATIQSIFKTVRGTLLFSVAGGADAASGAKTFDELPTPALAIGGASGGSASATAVLPTDIAEREAELQRTHRKICDTLRRVEGFMAAGDDRAAELGITAAEHPLRPFIGTCHEACSLLVGVYVALNKVALHAARQRYAFPGEDPSAANAAAEGATGILSPRTTAAAANGAASASSSAAAAAAQPKPSTARGLGLWAR